MHLPALMAATLLLLLPVDGEPRGDDFGKPLFDGKTLDGWTQRGGSAKYTVEAGEIVGRTVPDSPNSFLCTDRHFADFTLTFEFKVDPKLNAGVQIRSHSVPGYKAGRVHGYQVEIDPSPRAWTGGIYDEGRRGWLCDLKDNATARAAFRPDAWNRMRVVARGELIRTWLNGVPAADLRDFMTRRGFIALQVHATQSAVPLEVRWRNLRIVDEGDPWRKPHDDALLLLGADADASRWQHAGKPDAPVRWRAEDGALVIEPGSGSLVTRQSFGDCRLHVEFNVPDNGKKGQANGNSGVYLQGRYEVQILNSAREKPADNICGAIYGVKAPDMNMALPAGTWQTYDIWFKAPRWNQDGTKQSAARLTVYHNSTRIHHDVEVPANTGAGRPEGPGDGPLLLQDHGNRVRFRNIWISPGRIERMPGT
jgi:hypothetical protein